MKLIYLFLVTAAGAIRAETPKTYPYTFATSHIGVGGGEIPYAIGNAEQEALSLCENDSDRRNVTCIIGHRLIREFHGVSVRVEAWGYESTFIGESVSWAIASEKDKALPKMLREARESAIALCQAATGVACKSTLAYPFQYNQGDLFAHFRARAQAVKAK